jgi:hypothetical protein
MKCIDPWLTKNRRVCPVCKGKVILPGMSDVSDSESDAEPPTPASSERTPLLAAPRPPRRTPRRRTRPSRSHRTSSDPGTRARSASSDAVRGSAPAADTLVPPVAAGRSGSTMHLIAAEIAPLLPPSGHMSVNFEENEPVTDTDEVHPGETDAIEELPPHSGCELQPNVVV